jgi:hypothetical protein
MTLVGGDMAVVLDDRTGFTLPEQRLHHRDVDLAGGPGLAAANGPDHALTQCVDAQERLQPLLPLLEQLGAVHQHQRVDAAPGDQRRGGNGLAECGRCAQDAGVVTQHRGNGFLLVRPQRAAEAQVQRLAIESFVLQLDADAVLAKKSPGCIEAAARQRDMVRETLGAADHPGLVPHRKAHRLRLVELGVLEGRKPDQAVRQRLRKLRLVEVQKVRHDHGQRGWHRAGQPLCREGSALPGLALILVVDERNVQRMAAAGRTQDRWIDVARRHGLHRRQKAPLVGVRLQGIVHEHAAAVLARHLLQRQRDQVAEAAFGHRVLVREQPVIGCELQLPGAGTGVADERRAEPSRIPRCNVRREEDPRMYAMARTRNLQRDGHAQFTARLREGRCVGAPIGVIEVHHHEVA